jgi:hypothetical protein
MKLGILIPTIFRPAGLRHTLDTLIATLPEFVDDDHFVISIAGEKEDVEARAIAAEYVARFTPCPEPLMGPGYAWNVALSGAPDCDAYFLASDDMEFTDGWLEEVMIVLRDELHGRGLVGINDGRKDSGRIRAGTIEPTHYLMTRDFIVEHNGGLAAYPYPVDWTDLEANIRARKAGKWAYAERALVRHVWIGARGGDEHFKRNQTKKREAKALYRMRFAAGFPNDVQPILTEE